MKYCPKCSTQYDYDMSFCLEDGTALITSDDPTQTSATVENPPTMAQISSSPQPTETENNSEKTLVIPPDSLPRTVMQSENTVSKETVLSPKTVISQPTVASSTNPNNQANTWSNQQTNPSTPVPISPNQSFLNSSGYDPEPQKSKTGILIGSVVSGLLLISSAIGGFLYFQRSPTTDVASANTNSVANSNATFQSNNTRQTNSNSPGEMTNVNASQIFPDASNATNKSTPASTNQSTPKTTTSPTPTAKITPENKPIVEPEDTSPPKTPEPKPTPAPRSEAPKTVSGGVLNGKATNLVKPPYPPAARAVNASGAVNVQVTIDENGNVISASAVSGHPLLRQAAESAARSSKFQPTTLAGQRVKVTGVIVYNFSAQ